MIKTECFLYYPHLKKFLKLINNSRRKLIFNQYIEIGGKLKHNLTNFNLNFLSKYEGVWEVQVQTLESVHLLISKYRHASRSKKRTRARLGFSSFLSVFRNQRQNICNYLQIRNGTVCHLWFRQLLILAWRRKSLCPGYIKGICSEHHVNRRH